MRESVVSNGGREATHRRVCSADYDGELEIVFDQQPGRSFNVLRGSGLPSAPRWIASESLRSSWVAPLEPFIAASSRFVSRTLALLRVLTSARIFG